MSTFFYSQIFSNLTNEVMWVATKKLDPIGLAVFRLLGTNKQTDPFHTPQSTVCSLHTFNTSELWMKSFWSFFWGWSDSTPPRDILKKFSIRNNLHFYELNLNWNNQFNSKQIIQILQPIIFDYFSTHSYIVDIS